MIDVAKLLGFTAKGLAFTLYKLPATSKYTTFEIPKKAGGKRRIDAPGPQLRLLQRRLAELLLDCVSEIETANPNRRRLSHGFQRHRSIVTNAVPHRKHRYVLNLDLRDFFPTINFGRVRGFFLNDVNFKLAEPVATILAQIACHENKLPQGSPCSPVMSNLIGHILDVRLVRLAAKHGCTYTRYADDLTFSTNRKEFPPALARRSQSAFDRWILGKRLKTEIKNAGFRVNPDKTRVQIRGSRQEVTGLVTNEKINISQDKYRLIRAQCHRLFRTGSYYPAGDPLQATDDLAALEGSLAHMYYVKARQDRSQTANRSLRFEIPRAPKELYADFVFFKHFLAHARPKVITEGRSDIVYLRSAMAALAADFPDLIEIVQGKPKPSIDFLPPSRSMQMLLDLGNGTGGMGKLIDTYDRRLLRYARRPLAPPVILLTDSDDGGEKVAKVASKKLGSKLDASAPFHALGSNLYLIQVPVAPGGVAAIEDLFPKALLATKIDGKPFDKNKPHGDGTAYGKTIFADKVVRPNVEKIDFSGFKPLLARLLLAINAHAATIAAKA